MGRPPPDVASPRSPEPRSFAPGAAFDARQFYRWSIGLTDRMSALRRQYGGNLDHFLILSLFLQAELSRTLATREAEASGRAARSGEARGLNTLTVATLSGIPRESVRRKLQWLVRQGHLVVGPDGLHYLADPGSVDRFIALLRPLARMG